MDVTNITLEITTVVSVLGTAISLVSFWFRMQNVLNLQNQEIEYLKQHDKLTHKRIDSLKSETVKTTEQLQEKYNNISTGVHELKVEMEKNKGEILAAIEKIRQS